MQDISKNFGSIERLYTKKGLEILNNAHVAVVGLGGVGSWTAEALARSGVGHITLVDLDDICFSNISRQLHALHSTAGKLKVEVMQQRIKDINPNCQVEVIVDFFTESTQDEFFAKKYDYVADAIDSLSNKALLIGKCMQKNIPIITCGGAAGKIDPTKIEIRDLNKTINDPLLSRLRKKMRKEYDLPVARKCHVPCVFSPEFIRYYENDSLCPTITNPTQGKINCHDGLGTASFITGIYGLYQASFIVNALTNSHDIN